MSLLAHLRLLGRHRHEVVVNDRHWWYCNHHSHRWQLPCWRWHRWDGYCAHHNRTCYLACPVERP